MASTYLQRTLGTPTSSRIWTFSAWIKRSGISSAQHIFSIDNGSARDAFSFDSDDGLRLYFNSSASPYADLSTNRLLRDTSAWYHLVIAVDTTQSTADDRVKLYINGTQYTWDETTIDPALNYDTFNASGNTFRIGRDRTAAAYFDGLMSHVHFCDGTQLAPTVFGSTDSTTGEWKINTSPSFTLGNNGFTILKDGNTITDQSSNSNDFSLGGGTLTKTEDSPSNVFATLNPLDVSRLANTGNTFSNGNLTVTDGSSNYLLTQSTLAATTGKFYWEVKINATTSTSVSGVGVCDFDNFLRDDGAANVAYGWIYAPDGDKRHNSSATAYGDTYAANDIIGIALDMTNGFLYFSKNGTWQNSGNPESGASGTNAAYGSISSTIGSHAYDGSSTQTHEYSFNFGQGYFGTTAVSSAGTNASGIGIFEYDVPNGFTALSTKGLNL